MTKNLKDDPVKIEKEESQIKEAPIRFDLSSYGWDSDVEGLVNRLDRGDIYIPHFQRKFVWTRPEKSRFIESLIIGLPVPSIFLARDPETNKLSIIDGQQRLKTLQGFLHQEFSLNANDIRKDLIGLFCFGDGDGKKKKNVLSNPDRRALLDSIIHAVVLREEKKEGVQKPGAEYYEALIQLFKRLNTSGKPLQPQEIRASVFFGEFNDMLRDLNQDPTWREIFGEEHIRMKDEEIILRFLALYNSKKNYKPPMKTFLDDFMRKNRFINKKMAAEQKKIFKETTAVVKNSLGNGVFKTGGTFLLSRFDAVMVGLANNLSKVKKLEKSELRSRYKKLLKDGNSKEGYIWAIEEFINDKDRVDTRIDRATAIFRE